MMELSRNLTDVFEDGFVKDKKKTLAQRAVLKNGIQASCESIEAKQTIRPVFSIDLETGKVTDQKRSGRCWMFAALNTFRHRIIEKFKIDENSQQKTLGAVEQLRQALDLSRLSVIESFDHSNIQGTNPVSAMVVYRDGKPEKKSYRKFNIKTVQGSHEFLTTQEVVRRRYSRLLKEQKPLPDLILMDGGKVQMRAAMEVLEDELGLSIPIAGMVKDEKHKTAHLLYGEEYEQIELDPTSQAFHLLQRIQEEVHRYAITFHRQVRSKNAFSSILDEIEGVGPKTRTKLLQHFKTMKGIQEATVEEIQKLGISEKVAKRIKDSV